MVGKSLRTAIELTKPQIVIAADYFYNVEGLKQSSSKSELATHLLSLMEKVEVCEECGNSPCDPDVHIFRVKEPPFTPATVNSDDNDTESEHEDDPAIPNIVNNDTVKPQVIVNNTQDTAVGTQRSADPTNLLNLQPSSANLTGMGNSTTSTSFPQGGGIPLIPPTVPLQGASGFHIPPAVPSQSSSFPQNPFGFYNPQFTNFFQPNYNPFNVAPPSATPFNVAPPSATPFTAPVQPPQVDPTAALNHQMSLLQSQWATWQQQQQQQQQHQQLQQQQQQAALAQAQAAQAAQNAELLKEVKALRSGIPVTPPLVAGLPPPGDGSTSSNKPVFKGSLSSTLTRFAGINHGKLRSNEDIEQKEKYHRKLVTGFHSNSSAEIQSEVLWPHRCLDHMVVKVPPEYLTLTPVQFMAGETGILLHELPKEMEGTPHAHRLMHLNRLLTHGMHRDWVDCLNLHGSFLCATEQRQVTWEHWSAIKEWHDRQNEINRSRSGSMTKQTNDGQKISPDREADKKCFGIEVSFIKAAQICIKYQHGNCDQEAGHLSPFGRTPLSHTCVWCWAKQKISAYHMAQECEPRREVSPKGGLNAGKGTAP